MKVGVLLLAAGNGKRFGGDIPKQYCAVAGDALICHTLRSLETEPRIQVVLPVIADGDDWFANLIADGAYQYELLPAVVGGDERSISMQRGLAAMPVDIDMIAVHDAARPLPSKALLTDVLDVAECHGAAVPGLVVHDTIKCVDVDGKVLATPNRSSLRAVQTPQVARRNWFVEALEKERDCLHLHTDDASVLEAAGFPVYVSRGDVKNRKITTSEDMLWLERILKEDV